MYWQKVTHTMSLRVSFRSLRAFREKMQSLWLAMFSWLSKWKKKW